MYNLYCEKVENPSSLSIYSKGFKELDLKFKKPTGQLEIHKQINKIKLQIATQQELNEEALLKKQAISEHQIQNRSLQHAKKNCSSPI